MSNPAVRVQNVDVDFTTEHDRRAGIKSRFTNRKIGRVITVHALKDVSLDVTEGETVVMSA